MKKARLGSAAALVAALLTSIFAAPSAAVTAPFSFAVIGDIPYGDVQLSKLPGRINEINVDPTVQLATHLGDISSPLDCTDPYFQMIKANFDLFADPFVYTPGDNEWTDCHRAAIGIANPLDRLNAVRATFYPIPGQTLGVAPMLVTAQPAYPENVQFTLDVVTFGAFHMVGSNNSLNPWMGLLMKAVTPEQRAEVDARTLAAIAQIQSTFAEAVLMNSRAVVLFTQADMFVGSSTTYKDAYKSVVTALADAARTFSKPVYLINGDSHQYRVDKPLNTSKWLTFYKITKSVPNLTRYTIQGGPNVSEWLKFTVVPTTAVLTVQRVKFVLT